MTEQEVVDLMKSSKSEEDWNANCDRVKEANGGYPPFWYRAIVASGLAREVSARWGGDDQLNFVVIER